jgi:DMSO reductase anchor subunit
MGAAGTSLILALNGNIPSTRLISLGRAMGAWLVILLLLQIVTLILWLNPAKNTSAFREALSSIAGKHRRVLTAYLILTSFAILASSILMSLSIQDSWPVHIAILFLTVFLVYAAEYFGRGLFYIARVRQGV